PSTSMRTCQRIIALPARAGKGETIQDLSEGEMQRCGSLTLASGGRQPPENDAPAGALLGGLTPPARPARLLFLPLLLCFTVRQQFLDPRAGSTVVEAHPALFPPGGGDVAVGADADRVEEVPVAAEVPRVAAVIDVPEAHLRVAGAGHHLRCV